MNLMRYFKAAEKFTVDNSPLILTGFGAAGVITTAVLTGKATIKAYELVQDTPSDVLPYADDLGNISKTDVVKLVWPLYIPPVCSGVLAVTCIICANRIGTRRAAAMAAAYTVSEKAFEEYREKIVEKLGANKERQARDEVAQDRVNANPVGRTEVIVTGGGNVLCYDMYTGRYFQSDMETIKQAQNNLNHHILNNVYASLNDFYDMIGLSRIKTGDEIGWNSDKLMEIYFSTTMSDDQKPCIAIDFSVEPVRNYFRTH